MLVYQRVYDCIWGFLTVGGRVRNSLILNDLAVHPFQEPSISQLLWASTSLSFGVAFPANRPLGLVCVRVSILTNRFGVCISSYIYNHTLHNLYVYAIRINHIYSYMLTWWYTYPSEKYEFVSWDDEIPNIWKEKQNVPNHQPEYVDLVVYPS